MSRIPYVILLALCTEQSRAASSKLELQLDAETISQVVQRILEDNRACPSPCDDSDATSLPFDDCPTACAGASCWIDHEQFGPEVNFTPDVVTSFEVFPGQTISMRAPRVDVTHHVYFRSKACIDDPSCSITEWTAEGESNTPVRLEVVQEQSGYALCGGPGALFDGGPGFCSPISLGDVLPGVGEPDMVGLAGNFSTGRVSLRADYGPHSSTDAAVWEDFLLNGDFPAPLTDPMSLHIGGNLVVNQLEALIDDALDNLPDPLEMDGPVHGEWSVDGDKGHVNLVVGLTAGGCGISDFRADLLIDVDLSLDPEQDALIAELSIEADYDEASGAACAPVFAVVPEAFMATFPATLLADAVLNLFVAGSQTEIPGCVNTSGAHYTCAVPIDLPPLDIAGQLLTFDLESFAVDDRGLYVGGLASEIGIPQHETTVEVDEPEYGIHGYCGSWQVGYRGAISASGSAGVCFDTFHYPTYYGWSWDSATGPTWRYHELWANPDIYVNMPDLKYSIYTTGGIQTIEVAAPEPATQDEKDLVELEKGGMDIPCIQAAKRFLGAHDPSWVTDPWHDRVLHVVDRFGTPAGVVAVGELALVGDAAGNLSIHGVAFLQLEGGAWGDHAFAATVLRAEEVRAYADLGFRGPELERLLLESGMFAWVDLPPELMGLEGLGFQLDVGLDLPEGSEL